MTAQVERFMVGVHIERDDEDGNWVRYDDYQALALKLEHYRKALENIRNGDADATLSGSQCSRIARDALE